jgi:phenylpropionate dioxygenase-like ring-hydroxylating dioxygenase large terminal subunit
MPDGAQKRDGGELESVLGKLRRCAAAPLEQATAMPPELYTSAALYQHEQSAIFAKEWLSPGRAADIPNPGDYITFAIGDQPVFSIRGDDGQIRSFSNVCLHRMMKLVDGPGHCTRIVCPYHAWTYDNAGGLLAAPHMKKSPGFNPRDHRLPEIRTELWEGWIYVTLNDAAPSVAEMLAPLLPVVARYRMADYVPCQTEDFVWNTNWKLLTENFMEGYHLPVAHRRTVGAWFPAEETGFPEQRFDAFTYQTFIKDETAKYGRAHPANTRLEDRWRYTSVMPTVFPTHMYVLAPDHLWYLSLRPKSIGEVHLRFGYALAPEVYAGLEDKAAFIAETNEFFDRVNDEDRMVTEGIYQGARAPLARGGRLSWLEREIHDFMQYLLRRLDPGETQSQQPPVRAVG